MIKHFRIPMTCALLTLAGASTGQAEETDLATADLGEIDRKLNNPLTSIWSLTLQNNTALNSGDAVKGTEYSNNLFFQPFMPFEIGEEKQTMLTLRPVFPIVTQPVFAMIQGSLPNTKPAWATYKCSFWPAPIGLTAPSGGRARPSCYPPHHMTCWVAKSRF